MFSEGEQTEVGYLIHWWREHRDTVGVTIADFQGGPLQLVDQAVAAKKRGKRESRRGEGRVHDEIWCVFDIDEHPYVPQAVDKAYANGINLAVSNPCIELWFILHFEDQTAHLERGAAQNRSRDLLGCDKTLTRDAHDLLVAGFAGAKERAQHLDTKHHGDGSPPRSNPSSNMWQLVDRIRGATS